MTTQDALRAIAGDMRDDAKSFDGKPFTGATVGEYLGNISSALAMLAEIVATLVPAEDVEREPVPFKDFLPADESAWYRQAAHEDDDHASCLGDCEALAAEQAVP